MDQRAATGCLVRREGHWARARARRGTVLLPVCLLLTFVSVALLLPAAGCNEAVTTTTTASASRAATGSTGGATATPDPQGQDTSTTAPGPPVVKIGALFPLTGELAHEGQSALQGIRLAVEQVNEAGGIASLGGARLTVVEADTRGRADSADSEVARLAQTEGVTAIVGAGQSTVALKAMEAAERFEIPFLVSSGAADEVTARKLAYTFRLCPKADSYARDQVAFLGALKELTGIGISAVALLHEDGEFGKRTAETQKAYLAEAGIQVVADVEYSPGEADVHNEVLAIRQSGAQAVLTATLQSDAVLIAKDAAILHMNVPIVDAAGGVLDPGFLAGAADSAEGMMSVALFSPGMKPSSALEQAFAAAKTEPGSGAELNAEALYGYQAVWTLADALERGGSTAGPGLRAALKTTALSGEHLVLPQGLLTFDASGQNQEAGLLVVQVQQGRFVIVWPDEYAQAALLPQ
jgi:branched-chain amino acid transport system substrate-binding protein